MKNLKVLLPLILLIVLVGTACAAPAPEQEQPAPPAEEQVVEETAAEEEPAAEEQNAEETDGEDAQEAEEQDSAEEEPVQADIDGAEIYAANCARCHAPDRSGRNGPPLLPSSLTGDSSSYVQLITNGLGGMPGFGNQLSTDEIKAVVDFILSEPQ